MHFLHRPGSDDALEMLREPIRRTVDFSKFSVDVWRRIAWHSRDYIVNCFVHDAYFVTLLIESGFNGKCGQDGNHGDENSIICHMLPWTNPWKVMPIMLHHYKQSCGNLTYGQIQSMLSLGVVLKSLFAHCYPGIVLGESSKDQGMFSRQAALPWILMRTSVLWEFFPYLTFAITTVPLGMKYPSYQSSYRFRW